MKVLLTGSAGFIASFVARRLLERGDEVVGLDNINGYYDTALKYGRLKEAGIREEEVDWYKLTPSHTYERYRFIRMNLEDRQAMRMLFANEGFDAVVNLAAQAGVRYSITNPYAYVESNLDGFINVLEGCRHHQVSHLVYASSSSVYGLNADVPFSEKTSIAHPVSLYAASKKSNELMAHAYSQLYGVPATGLRFFTVYGPWGRPDMSPFLFTDAILHDRPIQVFNNGDMLRDFTYIDDIVEGVIRVLDRPAKPNPDWDQLLAERLGIKLYDKELLAQAAKDSGFCEEIFENHDERPTNSFLYSLVMDTYTGGNYSAAPFLDMPLNHKVFLAQFDTIKKIASEESCVIVGRCADYALASNPDCLSIFVHADMDDRIKRVSKREDVTESKAKDMIQKRDKQRSSYYNYYTCKKWGDSRSYDLTLNTSKITPEACVDIILDFRKKMEQKK